MTWQDDSPAWRSGPWSLRLRGDELADIAFDGIPVLRSVRAVVRDRDWETAAMAVDRVRATDTSLTLHLRTDGLGASFRGVVRAEVRDTRLLVICDLESEHRFETNRTGLVVLHPAAVAGAVLRIVHSDGATSRTAFPTGISPHQPVLDIAELAWRGDGLDVTARFEGEVFEMEDQRNWTDASFKTYSRPLSLPFPYTVGAGERVVQRIEVEAVASGGVRVSSEPPVIALTAGGRFPAIATMASTAPDPAPLFEPLVETVLVELDLAAPAWPAVLGRAAASGLPLDVRIVLTGDAAALGAAARALRAHDLARVSAFPLTGPSRHVSDAAATAALRAALAGAGVDAPVVGGARSHFTELNREHHRLPADLDGIVFSVTPLFHTLDTRQLVESLAIQRIVAQQAVGIADGLPVHIGPIGLRPHFNDVATTPPPRSAHADLREGHGAALLDHADPRQEAAELAAWTIASAAALAVPGVAGLSYFEDWGPRGIRRDDGSERPVAAAVRALAALSGSSLLHGASPDGLVWAIGAVDAGGQGHVLVASLADEERTVGVATPQGRTDVHLAPFAWARIGLSGTP